MVGACDKINAISLNVKINKRKSVHIRGYKLPINVQNYMQKDSALAKIWLKVVGGLLFLTHPVCLCVSSIVSESGASVYSASEAAQRELPIYDVSLRGAGIVHLYH